MAARAAVEGVELKRAAVLQWRRRQATPQQAPPEARHPGPEAECLQEAPWSRRGRLPLATPAAAGGQRLVCSSSTAPGCSGALAAGSAAGRRWGLVLLLLQHPGGELLLLVQCALSPIQVGHELLVKGGGGESREARRAQQLQVLRLAPGDQQRSECGPAEYAHAYQSSRVSHGCHCVCTLYALAVQSPAGPVRPKRT